MVGSLERVVSRARRAFGLLLSAAVVCGVAFASPVQGDEASPFRVVVVPDTQNYSETEAGGVIAQAQFDWIVAQAPLTSTVFVTHMGDVVDHPNSLTEWARMEPGFDALEAAGLPYGIAPGNHDLVDGGGPVEYDTRFAASRFAGADWFGGSHELEGNRSSWQTVSVPGHELLFVHLRHLQETYGEVEPVIEWLDDVLRAHPNHLAFVTTHEFTGSAGGVRMPDLRDSIADHCNVAIVLSGHRPGEAARGTFVDDCDRTVHHVLTNYQFIENGGDGFLRTLDIDPFGLEVTSSVYSPTLETFRTGVDEAFTINLSPLAPTKGDADCNRDSDVVDALLIAQYSVGNRRGHGSCPLPNPASELYTPGADIDLSGEINVIDALFVAQCEVGIPNIGCPQEPDAP